MVYKIDDLKNELKNISDIYVTETDAPEGYRLMDLDLKNGNMGENIFEQYLRKHNLTYRNITQNKKNDFVVNEKTIYEVKNNYKDNNEIVIETVSNDGHISGTGKLVRGWWYTSNANYFVFVSKNTQTKIQLINNQKTKNIFNELRQQYPERPLRTYKNGNVWQSWHVTVPLKEFEGYYEYLN